MHDNQRSIEGQCIIKAVARVLAALDLGNQTTPTVKSHIDVLFDHFAAKLDAYARLDIDLMAKAKAQMDASISNANRPLNSTKEIPIHHGTAYETTFSRPVHLSDEQVARGVAREANTAFDPTTLDTNRYTAPNGKTYAFASEKQGKRAYAIQKSKGWDDYQVRMLCQKYGFQSTKKIPVGVYEAFCNELQAGPPPQSTSSAHLDQPPF